MTARRWAGPLREVGGGVTGRARERAFAVAGGGGGTGARGPVGGQARGPQLPPVAPGKRTRPARPGPARPTRPGPPARPGVDRRGPAAARRKAPAAGSGPAVPRGPDVRLEGGRPARRLAGLGLGQQQESVSDRRITTQAGFARDRSSSGSRWPLEAALPAPRTDRSPPAPPRLRGVMLGGTQAAPSLGSGGGICTHTHTHTPQEGITSRVSPSQDQQLCPHTKGGRATATPPRLWEPGQGGFFFLLFLLTVVSHLCPAGILMEM